jgi:hypothetical protein
MIKMPWPELKEKLLALTKSESPVKIERLGTIMNEERFVYTHIKVIDSATQKENLTLRQKHFKLYIAAPHYERLLAYYLLKTQL